MAGRFVKLGALVLITATLAGGPCSAQRPAGLAISTGMPGNGFGLNELGRLDPGGATQMNIPIGYTLSGDQMLLDLYAGQTGTSPGWNPAGALTLGLGQPGHGISATGVYNDDPQHYTGHAQVQLWQDTGDFPGVSAGFLDFADRYHRRTGFVALTKRLGPPVDREAPYEFAGEPAWPVSPRQPRLDSPSTWGVLVLSGVPATGQRAPRNELWVPEAAQAPILDGMLGDDWQDAHQVKLNMRHHEQFLLGVKHVAKVLYVVVAVPSDRQTAPGSYVELCFETAKVAKAKGLTDKDVKLKLEWIGADGGAKLSKAAAVKGKWVAGEAVSGQQLRQQALSGWCGDAGDGVWRYPVFEFAIPFGELGLDGSVDRIGFAARANLPAMALPSEAEQKDRSTERMRWPSFPNRTDLNVAPASFEACPDYWGAVLFRDKSMGNQRISAPKIAKAPTLDGEIGKDEWADADQRRVTLPSGAQQTLYCARTDDAVYIALVSTAIDGPRRLEDLSIYLDPHGQGGLALRADDRMLKLTQTDTGVKTELRRWNEKQAKWQVTQEQFCKVVVKSVPNLQGCKTVVEIELPMSAVRFARTPGETQILGLGIETTLTPAPPKLAHTLATEPGAGKATYVTLGWGTGIYQHHPIGGLSYPVGSYRAMAEYDGQGVNVGLTGGLFASENVRLTLGWNAINRRREVGGPVIGTAFGMKF